ncbi:exopolyphosphatase [Afipia sp. P52-10]|uniref:exopolyphosphatase n=1 Tax=Afipia sp. P52-10 TaxID=1429916 RepID=UPI0004AF4B8C|nr:exopolyphosphatase [Afipia sp. P52-10]
MQLRHARLTHASRTSGPAVAVIDIGSNSVRLVVYEALTRSLTPFFNEKILCGLGREVYSSGLLAADAVERALGALRRFRALCRVMHVGRTYVIATAACRDAKNGPEFIARAEKIAGTRIEILSGAQEAKQSALGVVSGVYKPDGIVGDLGGGSLELVDILGRRVSRGVSLPLGGLALQDMSRKSIKRAEKIVKDALSGLDELKAGRGRIFYAVGGTWRALARLHISQTNYPLRVMHGYSIPADEALAFVRRVKRMTPGRTLPDIEAVADARRPLLAYAALVLEHIIRVAKPKTVMISTYGVREGLLFSKLSAAEQARDGLLAAASDLNVLRSRSPRHAEELFDWTSRFIRAAEIVETPEERRLRHVACLVADIGWRAHPDYRGEQTLNLLANGNFGSIDHEGRAFIGLTVYYRYAGLGEAHDELSPRVAELVSEGMLGWAQVLGSAIRVAHLISAAQTGVLGATHFKLRGRKMTLSFEPRVAALAGDRIANRFKQVTRLIGLSSAIERS